MQSGLVFRIMVRLHMLRAMKLVAVYFAVFTLASVAHAQPTYDKQALADHRQYRAQPYYEDMREARVN